MTPRRPPIVALSLLATLASAPVHAQDDPFWYLGGGFAFTPGHEIFEFSGGALGLRAGAGAGVHGPLRAVLNIEHLFFQVPPGRGWAATIGSVEEDRSQLTTAMLGLEFAPQTVNRSGPFILISAGAARLAFGDIRGFDLVGGPFTIEGDVEIEPAFGAGLGHRARPSTGHGVGLQGGVRLVHVPAERSDLQVVTISFEIVF